MKILAALMLSLTLCSPLCAQDDPADPAPVTAANHDKLVKGIVLTSLAALSAYDIEKAARGQHDTVSRMTWDAWTAHPWILFLAGYICGHLFWGK